MATCKQKKGRKKLFHKIEGCLQNLMNDFLYRSVLVSGRCSKHSYLVDREERSTNNSREGWLSCFTIFENRCFICNNSKRIFVMQAHYSVSSLFESNKLFQQILRRITKAWKWVDKNWSDKSNMASLYKCRWTVCTSKVIQNEQSFHRLLSYKFNVLIRTKIMNSG